MMGSFSENFVSWESQKALLDLQENEIKVLDGFRRFLVEKIKIDQAYTESINNLILNTGKSLSSCKVDTKICQVWSQILDSSKDLMNILKKRCEKLSSSTLQKVIQINNDKKVLKKTFMEERVRLENIEKSGNNDVANARLAYKQALKIYSSEKNKFDKEISSSKDVSKETKIKSLYEKYYTSSGKLHNTHNNYILSLNLLQEKQNFVNKICYPALLDFQQSHMEIAVKQWNDILTEYVETSNMTDRSCQKIYSNLESILFDIKPKSEYDSFIEKNKSISIYPKPPIFDEGIVTDYQGELQPDKLRLDTSTVEELKNKLDYYESEQTKHEQRRSGYETEIRELRNKKYKHPISRGNEENGEIYDTDKKIKSFEKKVREESGLIDMNYKIHQKLKKTIRFNSPYNTMPPPIKEMQDIQSKRQETISLTQSEASLPSTPSHSKDTPKTGLLIKLEKILFKGRTKKKEDIDIEEGSDDESSLESVEQLPFYHGLLPRCEAIEFLETDGDYLIRYKADETSPNHYVLSARHGGRHKHFVIQVTNNRSYKLDGPDFPSIQQLVEHYERTKLAVTDKSGVILKRAVNKPEWSINNDDIERGEKLGSGNFGDVFKGIYKKRNQEVAIKTCKFDVPNDQRTKFLKEGLILSNYEHPKIVKFIGIAALRSPMMIIMEYVPNGALRDYLIKNKDIPTKRLTRMCFDAAEGMKFLSCKGIIHRDLAARNCLVASDETVKISDFGLSRKGNDEGLYQVIPDKKSRQMPIKWTAPEGLENGSFTTKSDVWSFGVLMWEIFSFGEMPYPKLDKNNRPIKSAHMSNFETKEFVVNEKRTMRPPSNMSQEMNSIMQNCWEFLPENRPDFKQISLALRTTLMTL